MNNFFHAKNNVTFGVRRRTIGVMITFKSASSRVVILVNAFEYLPNPKKKHNRQVAHVRKGRGEEEKLTDIFVNKFSPGILVRYPLTTCKSSRSYSIVIIIIWE
jgi:hypothetical protein